MSSTFYNTPYITTILYPDILQRAGDTLGKHTGKLPRRQTSKLHCHPGGAINSSDLLLWLKKWFMVGIQLCFSVPSKPPVPSLPVQSLMLEGILAQRTLCLYSRAPYSSLTVKTTPDLWKPYKSAVYLDLIYSNFVWMHVTGFNPPVLPLCRFLTC